MGRDEAIEAIKRVVGPKGYIEAEADMKPYTEGWIVTHKGRSPLVVRPAGTEEVAAVVKICADAKLPITPQGGHTGLCGGATPTGGILLSLNRMNRIREIDPVNYTMTVDAGCVLEELQKAADAADRYFPLSLAAEGSCTIGGNLSTNAGGTNTLRYGNARDLCFGIEVVLPDGTVWDGLKRLRKDNTGYDLRGMFMGAEGTLGIITGAVLKLYPKPRQIAATWLAVPGAAAALELLSRARAASGDSVETFEFIPREAVEMYLRHIPQAADPLATKYPFYVLMEIATFAAEGVDVTALTEALLEKAAEDGLVTDATIAQSEAQRDKLWHIRESLPEASRREGRAVHLDMAVPIAKLPDFYARAPQIAEKICPGARAWGFGHFGDGNLHYAVRPPAGMAHPDFMEKHGKPMEYAMLDLVAELKGSFSAEHGIGFEKLADMTRYKAPVELRLMKSLKASLDPDGIMNPGKVLG
ncbi:FAD-binding oxidoreductase [Desertibaculum subflavum]|uniref:FAD-binding oxidoreductase n=1 Tax=Desertibaculum subflavum TaxID=2268458 RepID=UPI000E66901D